jgi:hypothetical protein
MVGFCTVRWDSGSGQSVDAASGFFALVARCSSVVDDACVGMGGARRRITEGRIERKREVEK